MYVSFISSRYGYLTTSHVTTIIISIWLTAITAIALQLSMEKGPDFCRRRLTGVTFEQTIGASCLIGIPTLITIFLYVRLVIRVGRATKASYKPPIAFAWDYELAKTNMWSCVMFVVFWLPFGMAVSINSFRPVGTRVLFYLAWFAVSKSCFNNLLYCALDRHFRSAYVKLFHYCCCKTTVSFSRRPRADGSRGSNDVRFRVHIFGAYTNSNSCRMTHVTRFNGRDVYEL